MLVYAIEAEVVALSFVDDGVVAEGDNSAAGDGDVDVGVGDDVGVDDGDVDGGVAVVAINGVAAVGDGVVVAINGVAAVVDGVSLNVVVVVFGFAKAAT